MRRQLRAMSGLHAITASTPFPDAEVQRIMLNVYAAYDELVAGRGTDEHFNRIAVVLNIGVIRAEDGGNGAPAVAVFKDAQQALMECDALQARHGRYGFTGPGLQAMREALILYEDILRASTPLQMHQGQQEVMRRAQQGHVRAQEHRSVDS